MKYITQRITENNIINETYICQPPKSVKIQLSSICNMQCNYCFNKSIERKNKFINYGDYQRIILQLKNYNVKQIGLLFLGESTLYPKLIDCIKFAKNIGIEYVFLTTNGLLIKDQLLKNIVHSGLDSLKFSINHFTQKEFKQNTNVNGLNIILNNLKSISNYIQLSRSKLNLYASTALYDIQNIDNNILQFVDKNIKPYVKQHYFFKLNNRGGLIKNDHFVQNYCSQLKIPCPRIFNNSYITTDLKVMSCCNGFISKYQIGDLNKKSFQEIWNDQKIINLRKAHLTENLKNTICINFQ